MQKYFIDNLISRFIKCLLCDTYIPIVNIWKEGKSLIKGFTYITQDKKIVVAKKDYNIGDLIAPKSSLDSDFFTIISDYVEGEFYRGITSNFESNSALYDSDTHKNLGKYLRYIRDMYDIDLMPYYNCYSGISSDLIRIDNNQIVENNTIEDGLISYLVPIRFNEKYTIYYNSDIPFYIVPVYYDGIKVQRVVNSEGFNYPIERINICNNNQPYLFNEIKFDANNLYDEISPSIAFNNYLHLLIQVPKNKYSNLLVLEGDYTYINKNLNNVNNLSINRLPQVFIGDGINSNEISNNLLNDIFKPYSSLRENVSDINYAFSDRLVEYLLYSPIIKKDRIRFNIKRIQDYASSENLEKSFIKYLDNEDIKSFSQTYVSDIWSNNLRYYLYNFITQNNKTPLYKDINGYVDKDSEFIIEKGKKEKGTI